jgi:tRNA (uracil-5-)-methyltransferase TRM9
MAHPSVIIRSMLPRTQSLLLDINGQFYQTFAGSFAETRRRIQPGVRAILQRIPHAGRWLDLGCGSGALAVEWARAGKSGLYMGLDFSAGLLEEARRVTKAEPHPNLAIDYRQVDLSAPDWNAPLAWQIFDGLLAFAALHHLPGFDLRLRVLRQAAALLESGGTFYHSEWQFMNSPKLAARRLPWETVGLSDGDVEEGDALLDWRHPQPGQEGRAGLRYVHQFSEAELEKLARDSGFVIRETFESDGDNGRLGLYQRWEKQ